MVHMGFLWVAIASLHPMEVADGRSSHGIHHRDRNSPDRRGRACAIRSASAGKKRTGRFCAPRPFGGDSSLAPWSRSGWPWNDGSLVDSDGPFDSIGRLIARSAVGLRWHHSPPFDRTIYESLPSSDAGPTPPRFLAGRVVLPCRLSVDRLRWKIPALEIVFSRLKKAASQRGTFVLACRMDRDC